MGGWWRWRWTGGYGKGTFRGGRWERGLAVVLGDGGRDGHSIAQIG